MPSAKSQPSANKHGKERRLNAQTPRKANGEPQRIVWSEDQRKLLEEAFQSSKFITGEAKTLLAHRVGVPEASIKNWFYLRRTKDKRRSLQDELAAIEPVTDAVGVELENEQPAPAPAAMEPEASAGEGGSEPTAADAQAVIDWLSSQMPPQAVYQPPHVAAPQPLPMHVPQVQPAENSLVEASGRVMLIRLRQLYEKDEKLFLRAANEISNAIFEYEVEKL
ncbi:paired box protein Pax-6-like protein [Aphelenchoides avenae]|nr:paired box protein Pax-6-like protein [Aphelenchus avenae]